MVFWSQHKTYFIADSCSVSKVTSDRSTHATAVCEPPITGAVSSITSENERENMTA